MANTRLVRGEYFNNPDICRLGIVERYFLLGLICAANDYGKVWCDPCNLRSIIFPTDDINLDKITNMLEKLESIGIICCYNDGDIKYCHFPLWFTDGWYLRQWLRNPRPDSYPTCSVHPDLDTRREEDDDSIARDSHNPPRMDR